MSLTGRFNREPEIQNIPVPKGVSEFQDSLATLIKLADRNSLGISKHLMGDPTKYSSAASYRAANYAQWERAFAERDRNR